jgi:hypothetical protein
MENIKKTFINELQKIVGLKCYHTGFSLGSIIMLDFGKIIVDKKPMIHSKTGKAMTRGEFSLLIVCAWRIEKDNKIYCTWNYYSGFDKEKYNETDFTTKTLTKLEDELIKVLENKTVIAVNLNEDTMDIDIDFEDNIRISIFNDSNNWEWDTDPSEMYVFTGMNDLFSIEPNDKIIYQDLTGEYVFYEES